MTETLTSVQSVEEKNIGVIPTALLNPRMGKCSKTRVGLFPEMPSIRVRVMGNFPPKKLPFLQA